MVSNRVSGLFDIEKNYRPQDCVVKYLHGGGMQIIKHTQKVRGPNKIGSNGFIVMC